MNGDVAAAGLGAPHPAGVAVVLWAATGLWASMGVWVSWTDLRTGLIPRRVVWSAGAAVAGLLGGAAAWLGDPARVLWAVGGAGSLLAVFEVLYRWRPEAVGYGDVRLIVVNGLLAGWWGPMWSWLALLAGAVAQWPFAAAAVARHGRRAQVRWAPGLVVGAAAVVASRWWFEGIAG
ncbi:MAG: A24 family peptidase [Acidimicrobiaceae bacterium]|nr:A24 family peptidase [Acidimicrobiaceae bacterium]